MGISLYKAVGYGVVLSHDEYDQVMSDDFLSGDFYEDDRTLEHYIRWTLSQSENRDPFVSLDRYQIKENAMEGSSPVSGVINIEDAERGRQIVMVLPPGQIDKWERYEDALDLMESKVNGEEPSSKVEVTTLNRGIPPYDDLWLNQLTGEFLPYKLTQYLPVIQSAVKEGLPHAVDEITQAFYPSFSSSTLVANVVPAVPVNIQLFSQWLNIFKDDAYCANLHPMFVKTWR